MPTDHERRGDDMHRASVLLRDVLVLNEVLEFQVRDHLGTSETDFQAMQHLMRRGQMTPTELAEALHVTPAAATTVIDRLVLRKHAERAPFPGDRRRVLITPRAEAVSKAMNMLRPMIADTDAEVRRMPAAGQAAVVRYLETVVGSMNTLISDLEEGSPTPQDPA